MVGEPPAAQCPEDRAGSSPGIEPGRVFRVVRVLTARARRRATQGHTEGEPLNDVADEAQVSETGGRR